MIDNALMKFEEKEETRAYIMLNAPLGIAEAVKNACSSLVNEME